MHRIVTKGAEHHLVNVGEETIAANPERLQVNQAAKSTLPLFFFLFFFFKMHDLSLLAT